MSAPTAITCPNCKADIDADSRFCTYCAFALTPQAFTPQGEAQGGESSTGRNKTVTTLLICGAVVLLFYFLANRGNRSNSTEINVSAPTAGSSSSSSTSSATTRNSSSSSSQSSSAGLTRASVEDAVTRLMSNLKQGGSVSVEGVQELPQQNSAAADLVFRDFKYAADNYGTPVESSKYNPKPLPTDRLPTPEEKFQPRLRTYSGSGRATLTRYNDGQWVLKEVNWSGVGWRGTVKIH